MSIRWRLTLWFSLILLVIMVVAGVLVNFYLQRVLYNEVDDNLNNFSARVHGTLHANVQSPLDFNVIHSSLPPINEFSSPGIYIELIDSTGKVVVKSDNLGTLELPVSPSLIQNGMQNTIDTQTVTASDGARVRIEISPMYLQNQTLLLEVAQSLNTLDSVLNQLRLIIIIGIIVALAITGALGALLVRRTLAPVEKITNIAGDIQQGPDLNRRVGYKGPNDEIGRLATTFDHMIERLNQTFEAQKHFIADASHELRTPLTVIRGNLDLLKRNMSDEDRQESLRAIESEATRMTKISSDLLLLAEVETGQMVKFETVSLSAMVKEEISRARLLAGNREIVSGRLEDINVPGDAYKLNQVLSNLVDNAIKYTADSGTITLSLFRDGEWARLEVADTGIGIVPDNLPHLFDRFYRVDKSRSRSRGGTGLGLAIVKGIVEQHGGKIKVDSSLGKGSTFTVYLKL
jgi:two-component system, OmpR family, sensor kinase